MVFLIKRSNRPNSSQVRSLKQELNKLYLPCLGSRQSLKSLILAPNELFSYNHHHNVPKWTASVAASRHQQPPPGAHQQFPILFKFRQSRRNLGGQNGQPQLCFFCQAISFFLQKNHLCMFYQRLFKAVEQRHCECECFCWLQGHATQK